MATARFITCSLAFLLSVTTTLSLFAKPSPVSYEWKTLEEDLNLSHRLTKLSKELREDYISISQAQSSIRYLLEKAYTKAPNYDPELGHLLVTSAALCRLPSAMTLMEKVINPANHYAGESWQCALQYLSEQPSEKACELLIKCLGMPWVSLNLSASFYLSQNTYARHDPTLVSRLQAVQRRLAKQHAWIIADTLSRVDTPAANTCMRQIYAESTPEIQAQILRLMATMEEDFLDLAHRALGQNDPSLQEAGLYFCLLRNQLPAATLELCKSLTTSRHSKVAQSSLITYFKHTQSVEALELLVHQINEKQIHSLSGCCLLAQLLKDGLPLALRQALNPLQKDNDSRIALSSSLALLMSHDPSCLESVTSILLDEQVLVSLQYIGTYSWPLFTLEWVPPKNEPIYPFVLATQNRSRSWLLDHLFRLPKNELTAFMAKVLSSQDEALHVLFVGAYSATFQESALESLKLWSNQPGKPWLRLASTLHLWNLHHNPNDLVKLQTWWTKFDWVDGQGYISTLPDVDADPKGESEGTWLLDFQTDLYFKVTRELASSFDTQIWSEILDKASRGQHTLKYLPLLALLL